MSPPALILTYHGIGAGPRPLFVAPTLLEAHLGVLADAGARVVSVAELVRAMRAGGVVPGTVALTFDDGFAGVASHAAPLLRARGWPATVYCVADYVGGVNDWPTQPAGTVRSPLLSAEQIACLVAGGFEIGHHTATHAPLTQLDGAALREELVASRARLAEVAEAPVTTLARPYGAPASAGAQELIEATFAGSCGTRMDVLRPGDDPFDLPRIDAHYLRRPWLLARLLRGDETHLRARRAGAAVRRRLLGRS